MRPMVGLTLLVLSFAILTPSCTRLNLFRRADSLSASAPGSLVGSPAPDIDGDDFDGKPLKLSDYRGKVVVLVFWASWCKPCCDMIPHERELVQRYRNKPFALLGVNNDENLDAARRVMAAQEMSWPILKTGALDHPINREWDVKRWPAIFVIDPAGLVRYAGVRGQDLDKAIETLLAEVADASAKRR